jgi:ribosomal protein RSM22 (predicted rRNA methylase)
MLPGTLNSALAQWLSTQQGSLAEASQRLSQAYRKGESSSQVSLAAYVTTRVPATFAANVAVHRALVQAMPEFAPQSLLDIGAGPGTASWAAQAAFPGLKRIMQCEQNPGFAALASTLNAASGIEALRQAQVLTVAEKELDANVSADLVVASYVLAELPLETMPFVAQRLWARAGQVLVLIEPGTPQGFARLKQVRDTLLKRGGIVVAPCTHQMSCPLAEGDWCHFKVRVQRSREHMHAKQATVPFEDEAFSYLVITRQADGKGGGRILAPPAVSKVGVSLRLCAGGGIQETQVASRNKPDYKLAKKAQWGDRWE